MEEMKKFLIEQGIWEREVDEVLSNFPEDSVSEDDLNIVSIHSSLHDLADAYIDDVVGTLDPLIDAVLDYNELGRKIVEDGDEYLLLNSGRVVAFSI